MVSLLVFFSCLVLVMVWFLKSFNDLGDFLDRVKIKAPLVKRELAEQRSVTLEPSHAGTAPQKLVLWKLLSKVRK